MNDTPVADRTDEQLVRTIAEWMGLGAGPNSRWLDTHGLAVDDGGFRWFCPHHWFDSASKDRERVMLAMPMAFAITHNTYDDHPELPDKYQVYIIKGDTGAGSLAPTLGRAFCEAVVMWIESQ